MIPQDPDFPRWLFTQEARFVAGADHTQRIPPPALPEIAFVGRSNVGKSTLINALTHRKSLARVSHTPGRTQQINFFDLGQRLCLVDLPGYGYANVAKSMQSNWRRLMTHYFERRTTLRCILVLIDSRHPVKVSDVDAMDYFNATGVPFQAVLTKIDQIPQSLLTEHQNALRTILESWPMAHRAVLTVSARQGTGIGELRQRIVALMNNSFDTPAHATS